MDRKLTHTVKELVTLIDQPKRTSTLRYKQPQIDREQVRKAMRLQWKDPGFCSVQFSKAPCMKAKILNEWEMERINMATRSYKTPKNAKPYRFDQESRQFPKVSKKIYPSKFQKYMKQMEADAEDLQFKEKRTMTEGIRNYYSIIQSKQKENRHFKPVSTGSTLFGFTVSKKETKRYSNPHLKTVDI